ncbi:Lactadherin [Acropora cervicornis]|uniref:Lactadherin n=1 Tax=Acropora cervicornis TaxID=6130 RepID=A0AAD9R0L6_ACRCE|nr:Lactadherin [Acropora cervicornis]
MLLLYMSLLSTMGVLIARCDSPYGPWTEWSDCSVEEGQGTMIRTRACVVQDCPQPGQYMDFMVCFVKACKCKCLSPNPVPEKEITNAPKSGKPSTAGSPKESSTVAAEKSSISRPSVPEEVSSTVAPAEISSTGVGETKQGSPSPTSFVTFAAIKETTAPGLARLHHSPARIPTSEEVPCADHPLGAAKGGKLPASSFTASSSFYMFPPSQGRLNGRFAWCANEDKKGEEYLKIHLPEADTICAIATQGTGYKNGNEHVTFYFLEYSKDGHQWKFIEEDGNPKVFTGNKDSKSTTKHVLDVPVKASYIRVTPLEFKEWPCLRVEIYGKEKVKHHHPPVEIEIAQGKQGSTKPTTTAEVATPRPPQYPPIPTCAAASKGIDLAIIMDSSSGVTAEEFDKLKMFVSVLVESIRSLIPQVQLGFIVYSDEPKLIMTLTPFDDVDVSKIIKDIEYTPGGHRTDLAMLKTKVNLFCHENCQDSPGCDNVMIVFTSKNTDPESLRFSFLSPIIKSAVSKSELIEIALGHADHVIKLHSPDNLDSTVIHKIETLICTVKPENKGKKEDVEPPTGRLVILRH